MRFRLTLTVKNGAILPINYQYPLSAWIYKSINRADADFANFLHEKGYQSAKAGRSFKFFTFSKLEVPKHEIYEDRLIIKSSEVYLTLSFLVEEAAEKFITGVFQHQRMGIGDKKSQVDFEVGLIEASPVPIATEMILRTVSPIVVSKPMLENGKKLRAKFLSPEEPDYKDYFLQNLLRKYESYATYTGESIVPDAQEELHWELQQGRIKSSLETIKAHTPAETKVRGYSYSFKLIAPMPLMRIGLLAGFGEKSSLGFGCVAEVQR